MGTVGFGNFTLRTQVQAKQNKANFKERLKNYDWTSIMLELNPERANSRLSLLILENNFEETVPEPAW